jgi:hypothetical protein
METIEYFSDFLRKIETVNFLAIGILIMVVWLLISGLKRSMGKKGKSKVIDKEDEQSHEE